jgi:hypothetical protein
VGGDRSQRSDELRALETTEGTATFVFSKHMFFSIRLEELLNLFSPTPDT